MKLRKEFISQGEEGRIRDEGSYRKFNIALVQKTNDHRAQTTNKSLCSKGFLAAPTSSFLWHVTCHGTHRSPFDAESQAVRGPYDEFS